jgi:hypothetical protein
VSPPPPPGFAVQEGLQSGIVLPPAWGVSLRALTDDLELPTLSLGGPATRTRRSDRIAGICHSAPRKNTPSVLIDLTEDDCGRIGSLTRGGGSLGAVRRGPLTKGSGSLGAARGGPLTRGGGSLGSTRNGPLTRGGAAMSERHQGVGQPEVGQPRVGRQGVGQPWVGQPRVGQQGVVQPGMVLPGVVLMRLHRQTNQKANKLLQRSKKELKLWRLRGKEKIQIISHKQRCSNDL